LLSAWLTEPGVVMKDTTAKNIDVVEPSVAFRIYEIRSRSMSVE
jgi:hypothetical protein